MSSLCEQSACAIVAQLRNQSITQEQLIEETQQRIVITDGSINALPEQLRCFELAKQQGEALANQPIQDRPWYHLHGLPICVKDLTSVAGVPFVQGSQFFKDRIGTVDDPLVIALKKAGGIIIAKSNTPEFGAGAQTYNDVFGVTYNPWNIAMTPGGSSGGSTAALAAGQVWGATGTDLGGSLRIPASFCGVVGLRPTAGLVPQAVSIDTPLPATCDDLPPGAGMLHSVSGPLARSVPDLALLLDAMTEGQGLRSAPGDTAPQNVRGYLDATHPDAQGAMCSGVECVAYSEDLGLGKAIAPVDPEIAQICRQAAHAFANILGAQLAEDTSPDCTGCRETFRALRAYKSRSLAPLVNSCLGRQYVKKELQQEVDRGMALTDQAVQAAATHHAIYMQRWEEFFNSHQLLLTPCCITSPFPADIKWLTEHQGTTFDEYTDWLILTYAVSLVPYPALSLPVGLTKAGLPVGLQVVSAPNKDAVLLAAAAAYERQHEWKDMVPIWPRRQQAQMPQLT